MAIYKRLTCKCGYGTSTEKELKVATCPKCEQGMTHSKKWYISYTHHGKTYKKAISPRRQDAREALALETANALTGNGHINRVKRTKFRTLKDSFLSQYIGDETNTHKAYNCALEWFQIDNLWLEDVTPALINQKLLDAKLEGKAPNTLSLYASVIKVAFNHAVALGMLAKNHLDSVKKPKASRSRDRVLESGEIKKLLVELKTGDYPWYLYPMVEVALNTGLRKIDIMKLKWENVDFKNRQLINVSIKKTKSVIDVLPMTDVLFETLKEIITRRQVLSVSGYIFHQKRDRTKHIHPNGVDGFEKALLNIGINDFRFHDLRHCFASHFIAQGGTPEVLMGILAHSEISMTMKYVKVFSQQRTDQFKNFNISN